MYYTYILKTPVDNEPFYVGKGKGNRASFHIRSVLGNWKSSRTGNLHKSRTIKKIIKDGFNVIIDLKYFDLEEHAFQEEKRLIELYGLRIDGGLLTNLTYGGDGYSRPGVKVDQYNMFGEFIRTFNSTEAASQSISGNSYSKNSIKACCDGIRRSAKGFMWSYHDEPLCKTVYDKVKSIGQYKDGVLISRYSSINEATKIGYDSSSISLCCKGKRKQHKGYQWQFI